MSDDSEPEFLEEGFNLDSPHADKQINYGTAAPVWQNKKEVINVEDDEDYIDDGVETNDVRTAGGKEVIMMKEQMQSASEGSNNNNDKKMSANSRQNSSSSGDSQSRKPEQQRQNSSSSTGSNESLKKMSYIQMAKLGYQELVNAIIRPPRCDYRVSRCHSSTIVLYAVHKFESGEQILINQHIILLLTPKLDGSVRAPRFQFLW